MEFAMGKISGRLLWAFLFEYILLSAAHAQVVRVRGDRQVCYVADCETRSTYGSGTVIAAGASYKPGKSLVLGCGHQFRERFNTLYVQGYRSELIAHEETGDSDLSLIEVDHDFGASLDVADDELPNGARAWVMGFGGDGKVVELPGMKADDNSILAQTRVGDSGGPVLKSKVIYGVLWGQENIGQQQPTQPRARYTCVRSIRRFVERHGYGRYVFRSRSVGAAISQPPRPAAPASADPRIAELVASIESLKIEVAGLRAAADALAALEPVPGPRGSAGAAGKPGTVNVVIRFQGKVVDTIRDVPAGKTVIKDLDEVFTEPK
jgi:hypothetical protein